MIDVTVLGVGGGMPMVNRYLSSVLLSYKGRKILLDCGEGTQVAMRKFKTGFKSIDIICISHFHGDHIFGLPGLLSTMGNSERTDPITIIGPIGLEKILKGLLISLNYLPFKVNVIEDPKTPIGLKFLKESIDISLVEDESKFKGDIVLKNLELNHSSICYGYSFSLKRHPKFIIEKAELNQVPKKLWKILQVGQEVTYENKTYYPNMVLGEDREGIKISFVTDTRPTESIVDFISESDLFICEGTYGDDEDLEKAIKNKHMTYKEAANLALKGNVKELLLTHFTPSMENPREFKDNAKEIFKSTIIAYDGLFKTINFK